MLINCENCVLDKHDECKSPNSCLCAVETNHNESLKSHPLVFEVKDDWVPTPEELKKDLQDRPVQYNRSQAGTCTHVAAILIEKFHFITVSETDTIYYFNGKIYDSKNVTALIKSEAEKRILFCREKERMEVYNKIKANTYRSLKDFDSDPYLLTLENGILDLKTLELKEHSHEHLTKILYPVSYEKPRTYDLEENLKDTLFWKSLIRAFIFDGIFQRERFNTVLEMMASVFVRKQIEERSFINLGAGNNGKSVILEYIESLLGKENVTSIALQQLAEDKFAPSNLDGKAANIMNDISSMELKKTNIFKILSSGQGMYVQFKRKDGFTLHNHAKLIFSCNKFPRVFDQSEGFFRRWIIIKWDRNFENDPENVPNLKTLLNENQEEKNLVFSNLIHLSKRILDSEKFAFSKDWKLIQKEWNENADPLNDFIDNWIIDSDKSKSKRETYQFYKSKMFEKGEIPLGMGQFSKAFSEYFEDSKDNGTRIWLNIDFKVPKQETLLESDNS